MNWFYVVMAMMGGGSFQMGDVMNAVPVQSTKIQLAMPDQATCEAIRALNHQGECWAKVADQK